VDHIGIRQGRGYLEQEHGRGRASITGGDGVAAGDNEGRSVKAERRFRLLAIDIDGTLVNSQDEITAATREALGPGGRGGIHVVLGHGAALRPGDPSRRGIGIVGARDHGPAGALIKDPSDHRTLFVAEFEPRVLCRMLSTITEAGYDPSSSPIPTSRASSSTMP
jgi:hypothetical protein